MNKPIHIFVMITVTNRGAKEIKPNVAYRITQEVGLFTASAVFKFYTRRVRKDGLITLFGKSCAAKEVIIFPRVHVWSYEDLTKSEKQCLMHRK